VRAADPASLPTVRVAHLSDLHIGKGDRARLESHLRQVIAEVNRLAPDLVVITGDVVNFGEDATLAPRARELLLAIAAPLVVVPGNHDLGFGAKPLLTGEYDESWCNFARCFHPFLLFHLRLGRYDFVGFDSGASVISPRVVTRGLSDRTVEELRDELVASRRAGDRGVVLFSHAPSRANLAAAASPTSPGFFGKMRSGALAFEAMVLAAAAAGQRVLHLAGHTHWSDVFEARSDGGALHFVRWPALPERPTPIAGPAALITVQSASHPGVIKESARGWGFCEILLGDGTLDNQLGRMLAVLRAQGFNVDGTVSDSVRFGKVIFLADVRTTDAALRNDDAIAVTVYIGKEMAPHAPDGGPPGDGGGVGGPDFSGMGMFTVDASQAGAALFGRLAGGTYRSEDPVTTRRPVSLTVKFALIGGDDPVALTANGAHVQFTFGTDAASGAAGLLSGEMHASIKSTEVMNKLIPVVAQRLTNVIATEPGTSIAMSVSRLFDTGNCTNPDGSMAVAGDGKIDICEVADNPTVGLFIQPDVQIYDANGNYAPSKANSVKDSLSIGFGFTAVRASFTTP
jgi:hypothetical protein